MASAAADLGGMKCVVMDCGSGTTKVTTYHVLCVHTKRCLGEQIGYAGEDAPRSVFPSITARSRGQDKTLYVGHQVMAAVNEPRSSMTFQGPLILSDPTATRVKIDAQASYRQSCARGLGKLLT